MKVIFLVDSIPNIDMFFPIIKEFPAGCEGLVVNLDRWAKQIEIENKLQEYDIKYQTISGWKRSDVNKILTEMQPSVIVMSHDATIPVDPIFIKCAKAMGIPVLYVPHGMIVSQSWTGLNAEGFWNWILYFKMAVLGAYRLMQQGKVSRKRIIETGWMWIKYTFRHKMEAHGEWTKTAVFGDDAKQNLISVGTNPNRIVVTGNPKFDYIFKFKHTACKAKICKKYHIKKGMDIILLLTDYLVECGQWKVNQRTVFVKAICEAVERLFPCSKLVIKLHPVAEKVSDYQAITKGFSNQSVICQNEPLWELLHTCRLVITIGSGAGLEAMAAGKPLVIFNPFNDKTPFDEASGAIVVKDKEDLLPKLKVVFSCGLSKGKKKVMDRFVYDHAYLQDGKAAKRIADLIVRMAVESKDMNL